MIKRVGARRKLDVLIPIIGEWDRYSMIGARDVGFLRGAPIVFASSFKLANHVLGDRDRRSLTGMWSTKV